MLPAPERLRRIAIVGGGLFPRTALVLRNLVPDADVVVIDANATNLNTARRFLDSREATFRPPVEFRHETFDPHCAAGDFDLVIVPLAFVGNRDELYRHPPAPLVLIHDWCWRRIGAEGARVSFLLSIGCVSQRCAMSDQAYRPGYDIPERIFCRRRR